MNYRFIDWDHDGDLDLVTWIWRSGFADGGGDFPRVRIAATDDTGGGGGTCGGTDAQATCDCGDGQTPDGAGGCRSQCSGGQIYNSDTGQCEYDCSDAENCQDWPQPGQQEPPPPPEGPQGCAPELPTPENGDTIRVFYQNDGAFSDVFGAITSDLTINNPPLPLPPNGQYMRVEPNGILALSTMIDIDGDGRLDMVEPDFGNLGSAQNFKVWRGTANGQFATNYVLWPKATWTQDIGSVMPDATPTHVTTNTAAEWCDIDGDGLLDLVTRAQFGSLTSYVLAVSYNLQGSFSAPRSLGFSAMVDTSKVELDIPWTLAIELRPGWRGDSRGLVDVDEDGLDEAFMLSVPSGGISYDSLARYLYRLNGDTKTNFTSRSSIWEPLKRLIRAVNRWSWYRVNDFIDLTGDGRPDLVSFSANGSATVRTDAIGAQPIRLLSTVDNGRGAVTSFTYARSTDPDVVETTTGQHNEARWVVRTISTNPGGNQPTTTKRYSYAGPVFGVESPFDPAPTHFLGFHQVTVDRWGPQGPASNRTVTTFIDDGRGHVATEWNYLATGAGLAPVRYETSSWAYRVLVGGKAGFWFRATHVTRTCDAGATEAACKLEAENQLTERETWTPWTNGGAQAITYELTRTTREQPGVQRTTAHSFLHRISSTEYRVLETQVDDLDGTTLVQRTQTGYNAAGQPAETYAWLTPFTFARTTRTFDALGNVLTVRKPNQAASTTPKVTTFTYDDQKLFVAKTVNELGHTVFDFHDVGTGALVRREGPSYGVPPCVTQLCSTLPVYKPEEWSVDGFGRTIQHRVALDSTMTVYRLVPTNWITYIDGIATTRKTEALRDYSGSAKVTSIDTFDGIGRVIQHSELRDGGLPNANTTYAYDSAGQLAQVTAPSPVSDGGTVTYRYQRDGLGRVTALLRPDGTSQVTTYNGLTTQSRDVSPADGFGPLTQTDKDPLGRLIAVHEPDSSGDHVTRYTYDVVDRMIGITDADGNGTAISYDLAGHRQRIARGNRSWSYNYDADGNITSEIVPFDASTDISTVYSSTTYDELDRQRTHTPASRSLSSTRMAQLGVGPVTTSYDGSTKAVGMVTDIAMPLGTIHYDYDARGLVKRETRTISFTSATHGVALTSTQKVDRTYNALALPIQATWDDGTAWQTSYDARGQVSGVAWLDPATGTYRPVAAYTRLAAGNPVSRTNDFGQRRDWQYDVLGRVTYDRVWRPADNTSWLERTYTFDGVSHLIGTAGTIGAANADADYAYDERGRLAVANGPDAYHAQLAYSPAGNILSANISGADTPARNVVYHYSSFDPQAVDQLVDATNGTAVAQINYDLPGSAVSRTIGGTTWSITPDGDDQIREVAGPSGTERYYFGPRGERVASIGPEGVKLWFGESETHFTTSGVPSVRWHHIAAGEQLARIENKTSIELQYEDALHNLSLALTSAGAVAAAFTYGGFGEVVSAAGAESHRRQFNGKEADATSGLRHYGYRSYDPVLLRWTAADPLYRFAPDGAWDEPQRANLYAFSLNNPLRYYDPDGRDVDDEAHDKKKSDDEQPSKDTEARQPRGATNKKATADEKRKGSAPVTRQEDSGPRFKLVLALMHAVAPDEAYSVPENILRATAFDFPPSGLVVAAGAADVINDLAKTKFTGDLPTDVKTVSKKLVTAPMDCAREVVNELTSMMSDTPIMQQIPEPD
ncbi:MAG TPA: RHS repeat-associated core domain-containing protein [Kofleriaceae bacterium]